MSASVVSNGGGFFTLTLRDTTQDWTQVTNQTVPDAELASAEVIAEAPSSQTVLPLADFGTVNFTDAAVNGQAIGNDNPIALSLVSSSDAAEATTSALTGGTSFTVTWDSDGSISTPATAGGTAGTGHHHHHRQSLGQG